MSIAEPRLCSVSIETGLLVNGDGHYRKTYRDLTGLYADADAFAKILAKKADDVAYEVTSYTPGSKVSDLITGVTRMAPGKVGAGILSDPRPYPRQRRPPRSLLHAIGARYHANGKPGWRGQAG